ncbi:ribonuclease HIII [Lactococcus nasutitermitis]|uniref:Ribonuclease HIII n=1 Tax=Lactococcus nasutitermitis TaxID=1652957 RepID=A0ABV9JEW0_9LACT|nr:ribonuclease HIII [Lactococcus nasutitermitis]
MNVVLNLDEKMLTLLFEKYASSQLSSKNPYIRFYAKVSGTTISVYNSGKVVFQGKNAEKIAQEFGYIAEKTTVSVNKQENIIGTDEVGNGSYFGGLMVVASFVRAEDISFLRKLGVADSKKLTDEKICQMAPKLMEKIVHVPLVVSPKKYNEAIESGYNAVSIKVALHNQAIFLLEKKLAYPPENVVIDAFTTKENYKKYVKHEKNQVHSAITLLTKAEDQFLAVAVSSIIARSLFLENLEELSEKSGFRLPSGAGKASDMVAAEIIQSRGVEALREFAKLHFANTKKASLLAQNRK